MAGNTFRTAPQPGGNGAQRNGTVAWSDPDEVFSVYFHVDRPASLHLAINAAVRDGSSTIQTRVGKDTFKTDLTGTETATREIGSIKIAEAGYVRVDLQGDARTGDVYAEIRDLVISSDTDGLKLDYVKTNDGNMFYWGRRDRRCTCGTKCRET